MERGPPGGIWGLSTWGREQKERELQGGFSNDPGAEGGGRERSPHLDAQWLEDAFSSLGAVGLGRKNGLQQPQETRACANTGLQDKNSWHQLLAPAWVFP